MIRLRSYALLIAMLSFPVDGRAADQPPSDLALTLTEVLRLAHTQGREIITRREDLRLFTLELAKVHSDYLPQPSGSVSQGWSGVGRERPTQTQTATLGVSQTVPGGGTVEVTGTATRTLTPSGDRAGREGTVVASINQPLLRGAGLAPWREPLLQAERTRRYQERDFALFRQGLTVTVAGTFWNLQRQQAAVEQARAGVTRAEFTYQQSQALMTIGKSNANDVFRAETNLLQARQAIVDEDAALAAAIGNLRLDLALDPSRQITIDQTPPGKLDERVDSATAIAIALERRLDLLTMHEQVEDAARAVGLAGRELLPRLTMTGSGTWRRDFNQSASGLGSPEWETALTLEIPFDRRAESLALERSRTAHLRIERSESELRERIVKDVHDAIRQLRTAETTLLIQDRNRIQAARRAEKAQLDVRAGTLSNRDLVDAQNEVRSAEDAWFGALIAYRVAELGLRRETGTLDVGEDGSWNPVLPTYATPSEQP